MASAIQGYETTPYRLIYVLAVIGICPLAAIGNCPEAASPVTECDC
jgi:hypothetical protein